MGGAAAGEAFGFVSFVVLSVAGGLFVVGFWEEEPFTLGRGCNLKGVSDIETSFLFDDFCCCWFFLVVEEDAEDDNSCTEEISPLLLLPSLLFGGDFPAGGNELLWSLFFRHFSMPA